jgi:hypothetical protein
MNANYFGASYYASRAAVYFNRVLLVSSLAQNPDVKVSKIRDDFFAFLKKNGWVFIQYIQRSDAFYRTLKLEPLQLPKFPNDYFEWVSAFIGNMKRTLPQNATESILMDLGVKLGAISTELALFTWSSTLHLDASYPQIKQLQECIDQINNALLLVASSSMILYQDPSTQFVFEHGQSIRSLLTSFTDFELIDNSSLLSEKRTEAESALNEIEEQVSELLKKMTHYRT